MSVHESTPAGRGRVVESDFDDFFRREHDALTRFCWDRPRSTKRREMSPRR
jgi:hypothetical protein